MFTMKTRIFLFILLLISTTLSAQDSTTLRPKAKKSYAIHNKGYFFDVGMSAGATFPKGVDPKAILEVYTTHGYQFSNTFCWAWVFLPTIRKTLTSICN